MTTTTIRCSSRIRAFTLTELLIGSGIATFIMIGVLSTFLMIGRSGANIQNYSQMETHSRRALEELSQDVRMAKDILWTSAQSVTLVVKDNYLDAIDPANKETVTYAYDATEKQFYRKAGPSSSTEPKRILIQNVESCVFARFDRLNNSKKVSDVTTKRLQITLVLRTKSPTVKATSNNILSASYILRNKPTN